MVIKLIHFKIYIQFHKIFRKQKKKLNELFKSSFDHLQKGEITQECMNTKSEHKK